MPRRRSFRRWCARGIALALFLYICLAAGIGLFVAFYKAPHDLPADAIIVVLSAGQHVDGSIGGHSKIRVQAAVALYHRAGPRLMVMTGGQLRPGVQTIAQAMRTEALNTGVAASDLRLEPQAFSTIQNALFTDQLLADHPTAPLVIVTNRFHLPRSWASFHWAGRHDLILYPADTPAKHWQRFGIAMIFRETNRAIFNFGRAGAADLVDWARGIPADQLEWLQ